ncbi:MAG: hypothetical protein NVSMB6_04810 [Burkholderiaceae bacterium]
MQKNSDVFRFLIEAGAAAPSADNMQPWRFCIDGDDLVLLYDEARLRNPIFPVDHQATLLTMGAVIENLDQACKVLGLGINLTPSMPTTAPFEFLRVNLSAPLTAIPLGPFPWLDRHTNRLPFSREPLGAVTRRSLLELGKAAIKIHVIEAKSSIAGIARMVRAASQVRFQTREIHEWFAKSLRFNTAQVQSGHGLDVGTFGLPPGGKMLLRAITADWRAMQFFNLLGGYRLMSVVEALSLKRAGALVAIVGPTSTAATLDAGRVMQRAWINLNSAGYGVQPYYVVSDQLGRLAQGSVPTGLRDKILALKSEVDTHFNIEPGQALHMLLRVGRPLHSARRALRRPQEITRI